MEDALMPKNNQLKVELNFNNIYGADYETITETIRQEVQSAVILHVRKVLQEEQAKIRTLCKKAIQPLLTPEMVAKIAATVTNQKGGKT